jgi:hypothetical protein
LSKGSLFEIDVAINILSFKGAIVLISSIEKKILLLELIRKLIRNEKLDR